MSTSRIAFLTLRYDPRSLARAVRTMRESGIPIKSKNDAVCKCVLAVASQDSGPEMLLEDALSYLHSTFSEYNPCPGGALRPSLLAALREEDTTCERTPTSTSPQELHEVCGEEAVTNEIIATLKCMEHEGNKN